MLTEALAFWQAQPDGTPLKPHLRSAVIQSFEFSHELSMRMLRRVQIERIGPRGRFARHRPGTTVFRSTCCSSNPTS